MITVIAPIYLPRYPVISIVPSLMTQSSVDWEAILVHDGPEHPESWEGWQFFFNDERIRWRNTRERGEKYGHDIRDMVLQEEEIHGRYVYMTNGDNLLLPHAVKLINEQTADVVAWPILHNYIQYNLFPPKLEFSGIDLCSFAVRADMAIEIGFPWRQHGADWLFLQAVMERTHDIKFIDSILAVHN